MNGSHPQEYAARRLLYLGAVSGLVGGFVWFALDTLTRGAAMGSAFFTEVALKFMFLLFPLFYCSLVGLATGLLLAALQAGVARGRRVALSMALPSWSPLLVAEGGLLLLAAYAGWERNGLRIGRPGGGVELAVAILLAIVPILLALIVASAAWYRPVLRGVLAIVVAVPLLWAGWMLLPEGESVPPPADRPTAEGENADAPNVLLVTIDTLRRDRLGCYGDAEARTPAIDRLAAQGVLFEDCVAQAPITLPSHSTIMTGTYPPRHGVRDNGFFRLDEGATTLAERLGSAGYATAAFVSAFPLDSSFGLDQGFDLYDDRLIDRNAFYFSRVARFYTITPLLERFGLYRPVVIAERKGGKTTPAVLRWLDGAGKRPFFLWVHLFDPHNPLDPPAEYEAMYVDDALRARMGSAAHREEIRSTRDFTVYAPESPEADYMRALYRAEVAYTDVNVGRILDRLDELGLAERTLVVLTADHGQSLFEHGYVGHSGALYAQTVDVPLIVRHPGLPAGMRIDGVVQSVDLFPTILGFLGIEPPAGVQGRSLLPRIRGEGADEAAPPAYFETLHATSAAERYRGLIAGGWKLIRSEDGSFVRLYDIRRDPAELEDLAAARPARVGEMERFLEDLSDRLGSANAGTRIPVDSGTREILKSLGYVW